MKFNFDSSKELHWTDTNQNLHRNDQFRATTSNFNVKP